MDLEALRKAALQTRRAKIGLIDSSNHRQPNITEESINVNNEETVQEVAESLETVRTDRENASTLTDNESTMEVENATLTNNPKGTSDSSNSADIPLNVRLDNAVDVDHVDTGPEKSPVNALEATESDKDREDGELIEDPPEAEKVENLPQASNPKDEKDEYAALLDDYQRCLERRSSKKAKAERRKAKGKRKEEQQLGRYNNDPRLYPEHIGPFRNTFPKKNGKHPYLPTNQFMPPNLSRFRGIHRLRENQEPYRPLPEIAPTPQFFNRNSNEHPTRLHTQPTWSGNRTQQIEPDMSKKSINFNELAPLLANALTQLQNNPSRSNANTQYPVASHLSSFPSTNNQYRNESYPSSEPDTAFLLAKQITQELVNIGLSAQSIVNHGVSKELVDACLAEAKSTENQPILNSDTPGRINPSKLTYSTLEDGQNDGDDMELDDSEDSSRNHILSNKWVTIRSRDDESTSTRESSIDSIGLASKRGVHDPYKPVSRFYREKRKPFVPNRPMRHILVSDSEDDDDHTNSKAKVGGQGFDQSVIKELEAKEKQIIALRESIARKEAEKRQSKPSASPPSSAQITTSNQSQVSKQSTSPPNLNDKQAATSYADDPLVKKIESEIIIRENYMSLVESELVEEANELDEIQTQIQDYDAKVSKNEESIAQYSSEIAILQKKIEELKKQTELVSRKKLVVVSRANKLQEKIRSGRSSVSDIQKQISKSQKRLAKLRTNSRPIKAQPETGCVVSKNWDSRDLSGKQQAVSVPIPSHINPELKSFGLSKTMENRFSPAKQPLDMTVPLPRASVAYSFDKRNQNLTTGNSQNDMEVDHTDPGQIGGQVSVTSHIIDNVQLNGDVNSFGMQPQQTNGVDKLGNPVTKESVSNACKPGSSNEKSRKLSELDKKVKAIHKEQQALAEFLTKQKSRSKVMPYLRYPKLQKFIETANLDVDEKQNTCSSIVHSFLRTTAWNTEPTIDPLHILSDFLQSADSVALPTELVTCTSQLESSTKADPKSHRLILRDKEAEPDTCLSSHTTYHSPLRAFRASLLSSHIDNYTPSSSKNPPFCYQIDPFQKICMYEVAGGECNDDTCTSQHFRDVKLTDDDYLMSLISNAAINEPNAYSKYLEELHSKLKDIKEIQNWDMHHIKEIIIKTKMGYINTPSCPVASFLNSCPMPGAYESDTARPKTGKFPSVDITDKDLTLTARPFTVEWVFRNYEGEQNGEKPLLTYVQSQPENSSGISTLRSEQSWIEYAVSLLPDLSKGRTNDSSCNIDKSLQTLSLALESHSSSEFLWNFYFELYVYVRGDGVDEIRKMFETATKFNVHSALIWWRYYQWEPEIGRKLTILTRMLSRFMFEDVSDLDFEQLSRLILDIVVQIVQTLISIEGTSSALHFLSCYLKSTEISHLDDLFSNDSSIEEHPITSEMIDSTLIFRKMTVSDITIAWLVYLHLIWFESIPSLFYDYPYEYVTKPQFFALRWDKITEPDAKIIEEVKLVLKMLIQSRIACHRFSLATLCRNYASLINLPSQEKLGNFDEILRQTLQNHRYPELWGIKADICMGVQDFEAAEVVLMEAIKECQSFALCNQYARLKLLQGDKEGLVKSLSWPLDLCYSDFNDSEAKNFLGMYRSLLDLSLDMPSKQLRPTVTISRTSQNLHLWGSFLMLSYALESAETFLRNLEYALTKLQNIHERSIFANEFIRYTLGAKSSDSQKSLSISGFVNTLNQTLKQLVVSESIPYINHSDASTSLLKLRTLKDSGNVVSMAKILAKYLSLDTQEFCLNSILRTFDGSIDLRIMTAKVNFHLDHVENGKKQILYGLSMNPRHQKLWRILLEYELTCCGKKFKDIPWVSIAKKYLAFESSLQ